jgi:isoleucyl-tRNA synthetase
MTLDLANITKDHLYAAAQDLGERLARQIALNKVLHDEMNALASRPCLACEVVHPPLHDRRLDLEVHFEQACELLNQIDADTVGTTFGSIVSFIRDRRELNAARRPNNAQEA